jgi:hypothetical protein
VDASRAQCLNCQNPLAGEPGERRGPYVLCRVCLRLGWYLEPRRGGIYLRMVGDPALATPCEAITAGGGLPLLREAIDRAIDPPAAAPAPGGANHV